MGQDVEGRNAGRHQRGGMSTQTTGGTNLVVDRKAELTEGQIVAAGALHSTLTQWRGTGKALRPPRAGIPRVGPEGSPPKGGAGNALYRTNVFAPGRAATAPGPGCRPGRSATAGAAA